MSKCCEECCEKIYKKIKLPESFDFSMDKDLFKTYYKPVGCDYDKLPKLYYENMMELINDYTFYMTYNPPVRPIIWLGSTPFFTSIETALDTLNTQYSYLSCGNPIEVPNTNVGFVSFIVPNPNIGKWKDNHPSFLRYDYNNYKERSLGYYKNPTWLLNFNYCGVDGKFNENKKFRLDGCDKWEVKWRLRVKPLLFLGEDLSVRPVGCHPMTPYVDTSEIDFSSFDYHDYAQLVNLINAVETKEGSRWLGLTPMRLETGIYNYDNFEFTPVVSSQGGYPQIVSNVNHTKWELEHKDKIQCVNSESIVETKLGPNAHTNIDYSQEITPTLNDIFYYDYGGVEVYTNSGFFTTQADNINSPGIFKINKQSLRVGEGIEGVINQSDYIENLFSYIDGYISPPTKTAGVTLNLEYNINGNWERVLTQSYNATFINLTEEDNQLLIGVSPKTSIEYVNTDYVDIPSIFGDVDFPIPTEYDYRYNFLIGFHKTYKKIDEFGTYTPRIQNYTKLSEEFTFELTGFTNVNLNKGDIGIYLKVLPDADNNQNINLFNKNGLYPTVQTYPDSNHILCNNNPMSNECYPWGELGISSKSGWQKIENVEYFPLLPLNRNIFNNNLVSSLESDDDLAIRNYRHNLDINPKAPALYLMIEEGWVSIEPTCEDC